MISRRAFTGCLLCSGLGIHASSAMAQIRDNVFCASSAGAGTYANANYYPLSEVDFSRFSIVDVPGLVSQCCQAMDQSVLVLFSDDAPIHASNFHSELLAVKIGVGNLEAYPFATFIAVLLHELGHVFVCGSRLFEDIMQAADPGKIELLCDALAGAAFAKLERQGLVVRQSVARPCPTVDGENNVWLDAIQPADAPRPPHPPAVLMRLDPRKLPGADTTGALQVMRPDGSVEDIQSVTVLGEAAGMTGECHTSLDRRVDFSSVVSAAAAWRTFGDLPGDFGHGDARERYQAFTFGYDSNASGDKDMNELMTTACRQFQIHL